MFYFKCSIFRMSLWDFSTFGGTPKADRPKLILSKPPPLVSFSDADI